MYPVFSQYANVNNSTASCVFHTLVRGSLIAIDTIGPIALVIIGIVGAQIGLSPVACWALIGVGAGAGLFSLSSWGIFIVKSISVSASANDFSSSWRKCLFVSSNSLEGVYDKLKNYGPPDDNRAFLLFSASASISDLFFGPSGTFSLRENAILQFGSTHIVILCSDEESEKRWKEDPDWLRKLCHFQKPMGSVISKPYTLTILSPGETASFNGYLEGTASLPRNFKRALGLKITTTDFF